MDTGSLIPVSILVLIANRKLMPILKSRKPNMDEQMELARILYIGG
jgi:hypothetical protein